LGRGRAICSANLHSRIIDSVGRGPAIFRHRGGKLGRPSSHTGEGSGSRCALPRGSPCLCREGGVGAAASPGVYSARPHSRSIDSRRGVRPLVPCGGGKPGRRSWKPRSLKAAPGAPRLTGPPVSRGRLGRGPALLRPCRMILGTLARYAFRQARASRGGSGSTLLHRPARLLWLSPPTS
jgi:hypothetical protein